MQIDGTQYTAPLALHRFGVAAGCIALVSGVVLGIFLSEHLACQIPLCVGAVAFTLSLISLVIYYSKTKKVPCDYVARTSHISSSLRSWHVREVVLAILSLALIGGGALALYNPALLTELTHLSINILPTTAYKCLFALGIILGFRTLVWRPLVQLALHLKGFETVYPVKGRVRSFTTLMPGVKKYGTVNLDDVDFWQKQPTLKLQTYDGNMIEACVLEGAQGKTNTGQVLVFSLGNTDIFQALEPQYACYLFNGEPHSIHSLRKLGFTLAFYNPPGYGGSTGSRDPHSDPLALEAFTQYLQMHKGFDLNNISLVGYSIGTGSTSLLSTQYAFRSLSLVAPFATIPSVVERTLEFEKYSLLTQILFKLTIRKVLHETFDYDNRKLARSKVKKITISEGGADTLMVPEKGSEGRSEGGQIVDAWTNSQTVHDHDDTTPLALGQNLLESLVGENSQILLQYSDHNKSHEHVRRAIVI